MTDEEKLTQQLTEGFAKRYEAEQKMRAERQSQCRHYLFDGRDAIQLIHENADHRTRGLCVICQSWIHPREWRQTSSSWRIVAEHPDYYRVLLLEKQTEYPRPVSEPTMTLATWKLYSALWMIADKPGMYGRWLAFWKFFEKVPTPPKSA